MLQKLLLAGVIGLAFGAGYFLALQEYSNVAEDTPTITSLGNEIEEHVLRNQQLEQTLSLVKRQIQTDRIAYASLQKTVEESDRERKIMQEKFKSQRDLLDRLKQKIDKLQ